MRLVSLGDLILDVSSSSTVRSSPATTGPATTRVGAGGQAANVAAWAAVLGAESRFVGKRGADPAGELASRELAAYGVELAGPVEGRNGVVVSIASAGERSMASDRGSAIAARARELEPEWFECDRAPPLRLCAPPRAGGPGGTASGRARTRAKARSSRSISRPGA